MSCFSYVGRSSEWCDREFSHRGFLETNLSRLNSEQDQILLLLHLQATKYNVKVAGGWLLGTSGTWVLFKLPRLTRIWRTIV